MQRDKKPLLVQKGGLYAFQVLHGCLSSCLLHGFNYSVTSAIPIPRYTGSPRGGSSENTYPQGSRALLGG